MQSKPQYRDILPRGYVRLLASFAGLAIITLAFCIRANAQVTDIGVGGSVQQTGVKRLGINLSGQSFYDSGQMLKNLIFRNPGFEGELRQSVLHCVAASATSCTDQNGWNVWPVNFLQGASYEFISGAAKGSTGTVTGNTLSDYGSGNTANPTVGITMTFPGMSPAPDAGSWVIVRMQTPGNAQAGWWTNLSGGASLGTEYSDLSPNTVGKQALRVTADSGAATITSYFDSYAGHSFVQLNGSYTLKFRAKSVSGSNQLNIGVGRLSPNAQYLYQTSPLTNSWQDYSYSFTANETGNVIGTAQVNFTLASGSFLLDDVSLTPTLTSPNNPTAYRDEVVSALRALSPGVLRYMDNGTDFGSTIDNMIAPVGARNRASYSSQATEQENIPMGLHEFLVLCQALGAEPWFTMPAAMTPTEAKNLIEYLGGATSTTYGAKRAALGQEAPWTSVFPTIHLELGNEEWNTTFTGEAINDPVIYGGRAGLIFAAARSSASYDPTKFDLVLSGWAYNAWWNQQELQSSAYYDSIDAAPYLFNALTDYGSNEAIFGPMFAEPEQRSSATASGNYMYQQAQTAATAARPAKLTVYEVNLSTVNGTAPQSVVNSATASVGAGIAVADHMLIMMRDLGITTQSMFALPEYVNGFINNSSPGNGEVVPLWGAVIDMGGTTNRKRPQYLAEQLANTAIMPTMLATTQSGVNPTWNQASSANTNTVGDSTLNNAHYLQSFAFTDGTNQSVIVFNLSRTTSLPVTFSGPYAPSGNVTVDQLTSTNITDTNESAALVNTTTTSLTNFNPASPYSLPPYSMTAFLSTAASLAPSTTTLSASSTSISNGQNVTFTATVFSQSGATPTGSVMFMDGSTSIGSAALNSGGVASLGNSSLSVGNHSITALYGGDSLNRTSSSGAVSVVVTQASVTTTTSIAASSSSITDGQNVTFTATVHPQTGSSAPTGSVTFFDGSAQIGAGTLNSSAVVTFSTSTLGVGTHSVTASYGGDQLDGTSTSNSVSVAVSQNTTVSTTTSLSESSGTIAPGQNITFTAAVAPQTGGGVPTGTVTFMDGSSAIGSGWLNNSGVATFNINWLGLGSHWITASYGGDSKDNGSVSNGVTTNVLQAVAATKTVLSASSGSVPSGQTVKFTAVVTPQSGNGVPGGAVSFMDGSTVIGTGWLNGSGVATFYINWLGAGSHWITASYAGDSGLSASSSNGVTVTIIPQTAATVTNLTTSATYITSGQSVTFTTSVSQQSGSVIPTGTVTVVDGSTPICSGSLNAGGVITCSTSSLGLGSHWITASYTGDSKNATSSSNGVTETVAK